MPELDEAKWLEGVRARDPVAFSALYHRWKGPLYRFGLHMSGRSDVAEDATQEAFMNLIRQPDLFDPSRGEFGNYLFGIVRHYLRKRSGTELRHPPIGDADFTASDSDASRMTEIADVRAAVLALPRRFREAIALCDLQEMPYEQAAALLGCAVGTVRSRLHRGRRLLSERMQTALPASAMLRGVSL